MELNLSSEPGDETLDSEAAILSIHCYRLSSCGRTIDIKIGDTS